MSAYPHTDDLRDRIATHLARFDRQPLDGTGLRRTAVAVTVLANENGDACLLLTRRAATLRAHSGQWALPGGSIDDGETPEDAARRELHEEVALDVPPVAVLGSLDDYATRSGFLITPVVVWVGPGARLVANPAEVSSVHLVPLSTLDHSDVPRLLTIPESDRPVLQVPLHGVRHPERPGLTLVHAPTAAFLYQLREVGLHGRDTRVAHLEQPVFAWR